MAMAIMRLRHQRLLRQLVNPVTLQVQSLYDALL